MSRRHQHGRGSLAASPVRSNPPAPYAPAEWGALLALCAASLVYYLDTFSTWFIRDDYAFLLEIRRMGWLERLAPHFYLNAWYRPWSREIHFGMLHRIFGDRPVAFHFVGAALFVISVLGLYDLVRNISGRRAGLFAAALWALTPAQGLFLSWISSSQDLWMFALGFLALVLCWRGHFRAAGLAFFLALASKETSFLVLPLAAWMVLQLKRRSFFDTVGAIRPLLFAAVAWTVIHPLTPILFREHRIPPELVGSILQSSRLPAPLGGLLVGAASLFRLELGLGPLANLAAIPAFAWVGLVLILCAAVFFGYGGPGKRTSHSHAAFWLGWIGLGLLPILPASAQLHVSYAAWAGAGFAGLAGAWLARAPAWAAGAGLLALSLPGAAIRYTPQSDWYSEWSTRRESAIQSQVRPWLLRAIPNPAAQTEFYYLRAPENSGLFARTYGSRLLSLEYWYGDAPVSGYLIPEYRASGNPQQFVMYREAPAMPLLLKPGDLRGAAPGDLQDAVAGQVRLAQAFMGTREFIRAGAALDVAGRAAPGDGSVPEAMGRLAIATADTALLRRSAQRALALAPSSAEARILSGYDDLIRGGGAEAARHGREAMRLDPGSSEAAVLVGRAEESLHRRAEALEAYREALRRNPDEVGRAELERSLNRLSRAR